MLLAAFASLNPPIPAPTCSLQELKKKELDELDAIFSELGISVEEQAKRDAEAEKKRKKKEKKKAAAGDAAANGDEQQQQQQEEAAAPAAAGTAAEQPQEDDEPSGEVVDPAAVSAAAGPINAWTGHWHMSLYHGLGEKGTGCSPGTTLAAGTTNTTKYQYHHQ